MALLLSYLPMTSQAQTLNIKEIETSQWTKGLPPANYEDFGRLVTIINNVSKYGLNEWYRDYKKLTLAEDGYLNVNVRTNPETYIRETIDMMYAVATALKLDVYDEDYVGVSKEEATKMVVDVAKTLARLHKANGLDLEGAWGDQWQSASWAYSIGFVGWLLWDNLETVDQQYIYKMIEHEANRSLPVMYYRNKKGQIIRKGDSGAEENAWNAALYGLAVAMMPEHPNAGQWKEKLLEEMISAAARPSDVTSDRIVDGKPLSQWLNGSNIEEDGTLVNHGFIHPNYMTFIHNNITVGLVSLLGGQEMPEATLFNADKIYQAYTDLTFDPSRYNRPGGQIYKQDTWDIYYPQKNDKGTSYIIPFAFMDVAARTFGYDAVVKRQHSVTNKKLDAAYWEDYHMGRILAMQNRFTDGHAYMTDSRNNSREHTATKREAVLAKFVGKAILLKYMKYQGVLDPYKYVAPVEETDNTDKEDVNEDVITVEFEETTIEVSQGDNYKTDQVGPGHRDQGEVEDGRAIFFGNEVEDYISFRYDVAQAGTYELKIKSKGAPNKGIYAVISNGDKVHDGVDFYLNPPAWKTYTIGEVELKQGENELKLQVVGKNSASKDYRLVLDDFVLVKKPDVKVEKHYEFQDLSFVATEGINTRVKEVAAGEKDYSEVQDSKLIFFATGVGNQITWNFEVPKSGVYTLSFKTKKAPNKGIYTVEINGDKEAILDFYGLPQWTSYTLDNVTLREGNNTLTFRVNGKRIESIGHRLVLDDFDIVKK